jgi:predicted amidohydrolase
MQDLEVTLIQRELAWEAAADNRSQIETQLRQQRKSSDLVVLPEMFTTGFSMNAIANAEQAGGETEQWMQALAQELDCAITGSIAVDVNEGVYNPFRCGVLRQTSPVSNGWRAQTIPSGKG